jgi:hypothetical protein
VTTASCGAKNEHSQRKQDFSQKLFAMFVKVTEK